MEEKLWIVGLARDCEDLIVSNVQALERLLPEHQREFVILESNSKDHSRYVIEDLARKRVDVRAPLISPDHIPYSLNRTVKLARLRNLYLKLLADLADPNDLIAVVDWDIDFSKAVFEPKTKVIPGNKIVCATSFPRYYDIFALRNDKQSQSYRQKLDECISAGKNPFVVYLQSVVNPQKQLSKESEPKSVYSAFGGLAIYTAGQLLKSRYSGEVDCEHVSLNAQLKARGNEVLIDPGIRIPAPKEHIRISGGIYFIMMVGLSRLPNKLSLAIYNIFKRPI